MRREKEPLGADHGASRFLALALRTVELSKASNQCDLTEKEKPDKSTTAYRGLPRSIPTNAAGLSPPVANLLNHLIKASQMDLPNSISNPSGDEKHNAHQYQ